MYEKYGCIGTDVGKLVMSSRLESNKYVYLHVNFII